MITVALALLVAGCGGDAASGDGGAGDDAGPRGDGATGGADGGLDVPDGGPAPVGTVEVFADLGAPSDSVALGPTAGELFVSLPDRGEVVRVAPDGTVTTFAAVPEARGLAIAHSGELLVAGARTAGGDGAIWRVGAGGPAELVVADAMGMPLAQPDSIAVAPGGRIVFDDAERYGVMHAAMDGSDVQPVTTAVAAPGGLAFWRDDTELLVASWTADTTIAIPYDAAAGTYGRPRPGASAPAPEGVAITAGGDAILISATAGLLRQRPGATAAERIVGIAELGSPAGAAFGAGPFGRGWLYVTDRAGPLLRRVRLGEAGAPLPLP